MNEIKKIHLDILNLKIYNNTEINEILSTFTIESDLVVKLENLLNIKEYKNEEVCSLTEIVTNYLMEYISTNQDKDLYENESSLFNALVYKVLEMKFTKPTRSITSMLLSYMECLSKLFNYTIHKQKILTKFLAALSDKSIAYLHKAISPYFINILKYFEALIVQNEIYKQINLTDFIDHFDFHPELFIYLINNKLINNLLFKYKEEYFIYWLLKKEELSILTLAKRIKVIPYIYYSFDKNELFGGNESEKWFVRFFDELFVNDLIKYVSSRNIRTLEDSFDVSNEQINSIESINSCKYCTVQDKKYLSDILNDLKNKQLTKLTDFTAKFLRYSHRTDLIALGNLISKEKNINELKIFLNTFNFSGLFPLKALKMFLESFILPGESQVIYRVIECFSEKYISDQEDISIYFEDVSLEKKEDNIFVYFYALIQLNTTLHNPYVTIKPTLQNFQNTLKNENIKKEIIINDFNEIKENPFIYTKNNTFSLINYQLYKEIDEALNNENITQSFKHLNLENKSSNEIISSFNYDCCDECLVVCYKDLIQRVSFCCDDYFKLCKLFRENDNLVIGLREMGEKILENKLEIKEIKIFLQHYFYAVNNSETNEECVLLLRMPFSLFNFILSNKVTYFIKSKKLTYEPIYIDFIRSTQKLSNEMFYLLTSLEIKNEFDNEMMYDILQKNIWRINHSKVLINEEALINKCVEYNLKEQFNYLIKNKFNPLFMIECYHRNKDIFMIDEILPLLDESVDSFKLLLLISDNQLFNKVISIKKNKVNYSKVINTHENVEYKRKDIFICYSYEERFKNILSIGKNVVRMMISSKCIGNVKILLNGTINDNEYDSLIYLVLKCDTLNDLDLKKYTLYLFKLLSDKYFKLYLSFIDECIGILFMIKNKELLNYLIELFKYKCEKYKDIDQIERVKNIIKDYELIEEDWEDVYEI